MQLTSFPGNQYKQDFFGKLNYPFIPKRSILDVGCGGGSDGAIFMNYYNLHWYGTDIYEDPLLKNLKANFRLGNILKLPYPRNKFDYVFTHDVLHHLDEPAQSKNIHFKALAELRRVCKKNGVMIIVEGNRFNPLFYPHMVLLLGHNHFRQTYFKDLIKEAFSRDAVKFHFFEAHLYPSLFLPLFRIYEWIMEHLAPESFLAYNAALITKK